MTCGIYQLRSPSGKRYIGSSKNIEKRVAGHKRDALSGKHGNKALISAYAKYGELEPSILIICIERDLLLYEQIAMDAFNPEYNQSLIAGKVDWTPENREKLSKALTGRKLSASHRQNIGKGVKGTKHSDEAKLNMSLGQVGNKKGAANKGRIFKPETLARMAKSQLGNSNAKGKRTIETRLKQSIARRDWWAKRSKVDAS